MRLCTVGLSAALISTLIVDSASAHGPQIQITLDGTTITTRTLIQDGPYSNSLTAPKSVYIMPLAQTAGVWFSRPNGTMLPGDVPEFNSGPGFAYGYGYNAVTNPAPFPIGSKFKLEYTAGLKLWNGASFIDAGATELEALRGSLASPADVAKTNDLSPFEDLLLPGSGLSFSNAEGHSGLTFRMLGDGASTTSPVADGVYLVSLKLSNTGSPNEVAPVRESAPFYIVLNKDGAPSDVSAAVASLGFAAGQVQSVPEPSTVTVVGGAIFCLGLIFRPATSAKGRMG